MSFDVIALFVVGVVVVVVVVAGAGGGGCCCYHCFVGCSSFAVVGCYC